MAESKTNKFVSNGFKKVCDGIKVSNSLRGEDMSYYESFLSFQKAEKKLESRLLRVIQGICNKVQPEECTFADASDDFDRFDSVVESINLCLESVDVQLDSLAGLNDPEQIRIAQEDTDTSRRDNKGKTGDSLRPQQYFKRPVDNYCTFKPILSKKPHALVPLDIDKTLHGKPQPPSSPLLSPKLQKHLASLHTDTESTTINTIYHPYQTELENLRFNEDQVCSVKEQMYKPLSKDMCKWIDTVDDLKELSEELCQVKEFAVDLEHHNLRSYIGFTCLMQISTRNDDYLIDTISLRDELEILNSSFTNPNIVKVFHGADMDIQWLQRDHGLYVVNMFDTGQAARVLEYPSFGLAFLLKKFAQVNADKKYQLADWRVRPIPDEMQTYAQMDTHYLLYIYDRLKNEAIARSEGEQINQQPSRYAPIDLCSIFSKLYEILEKSKNVCLKIYNQDVVNNILINNILQRHRPDFSKLKTKVFEKLYMWRDNLGRKLDESTGFILSNAKLFRIADNLPRTKNDLSKCCRLSYTQLKYIDIILNIVKEASTEEGLSPFPTNHDNKQMGSPLALQSLQSLSSSKTSPSPVPKFNAEKVEICGPIVNGLSLFDMNNNDHGGLKQRRKSIGSVKWRFITSSSSSSSSDMAITDDNNNNVKLCLISNIEKRTTDATELSELIKKQQTISYVSLRTPADDKKASVKDKPEEEIIIVEKLPEVEPIRLVHNDDGNDIKKSMNIGDFVENSTSSNKKKKQKRVIDVTVPEHFEAFDYSDVSAKQPKLTESDIPRRKQFNPYDEKTLKKMAKNKAKKSKKKPSRKRSKKK